MPSLSNQGTRPLAIPAAAAAPQGAGRPASAVGAPGARAPGEPERDSSVRLSAQALTQGAAVDAGKSSIEIGRQFMQRMAEAVFGEAAEGARFDFDNITLDSAAGFAAAATYSSGPNGATSSAAFSLTESAHFVGTGQLTLADGKTYDFEVEVQYQASVSAAASTTEAPATPDMILTGKQLPPIRYPGGIEDLFKLLGRELSTESGDPGKLTLRLMRLVDRAALLAPRLPDEQAPTPAAARQMAANAYAGAGAIEA